MDELNIHPLFAHFLTHHFSFFLVAKRTFTPLLYMRGKKFITSLPSLLLLSITLTKLYHTLHRGVLFIKGKVNDIKKRERRRNENESLWFYMYVACFINITNINYHYHSSTQSTTTTTKFPSTTTLRLPPSFSCPPSPTPPFPFFGAFLPLNVTQDKSFSLSSPILFSPRLVLRWLGFFFRIG